MSKCKEHNLCITSAIAKAEEICFAKGLNFTRLRKNILKMIWESHVPLKAYDILDKLKKEDKDVDAKPITVYRALDFLLENKIIHKIESNNTYLGCSHPASGHNCYFTICKICNEVEELCETRELKEIYSNLNSKNFISSHITLEIVGICKNCH